MSDIEELDLTPNGVQYEKRQFVHKKFPMVIHSTDNGMIQGLHIYSSCFKEQSSLQLSVEQFVTLEDAERMIELLSAVVDYMKKHDYRRKKKKEKERSNLNE